MRRSLVAVLGAVLLWLPTPVSAQRVTGNIVGTVKDDSGSAMPGVNVTITGDKINGTQATVSNGEGYYRFIALPPGVYNVTFALTGFATLNRQAVKVGLGGTEEISVVMKVRQQTDEITVIGETPVVDTQSNQVSTNYDKDWVRNAPVPRFSMFDLLAVAPGVSQNSQGGTTFSVFGSGTDENSFQIDGTNLTASATGQAWPYPNTDAIEEIEVLSLGAPAEYGNLTGAVMNVVTRQGTNDFHGDANFYFQSDGLTNTNTTSDENGGFPFHREHFYDGTFQILGPIIKDKLHFFASYQYQTDAKSPAGVDPQFFTDETAHRPFLKLNWQISPKHKVAFAYHNDYYKLPATPAANLSPSNIGSDNGSNPTPNLMYTGVLSDRTVLEARVAGFWGHDHLDPLVGQRVQPYFYDLDTGQATGGLYSWYDDKTYQSASSVKISHFADNFLGASHDFKFGVQYVNGGVNDGRFGYNDQVFTYDYTDYYGNTYKVAYGYDFPIYSYATNTDGVGVFFDDTVRVNDRLTLNLGVRYDHNKARIPDLDILDDEGNPTGDIIPKRDLYTWNVLAPRVGFTLKLTGDGKTALKGHYGRYYRGVITAEYSASVATSPGITRTGAYDLATGTFIDPVISRSSQNQSIDPNYTNPYTDQFIGSLERELVRDVGLSLHYVHKQSRNGSAWRDTTGQFESVTIFDDTGPGATNQPVVVQRITTDPADSLFVLSNDARVKTDTNAFTAQLTKRMSHGWQFVAAYTYLDSKGVLPSTRNGLLSSQTAAARYTDFGQNPNDFVNAGGKLLADRPHTFKVQAVAELPHGFLIGANYLFQSGRAWARRRRIPDLGYANAVEINIDERDGSRRVPNQSNLDLRLQKSFKFTKDVQFRLFADFLNVLNAGENQGVLGRRVDVPETFGVASDFLLPRRLMLGAKLTF
jgi:Carboxypeptidase regulatory-like domain/TonB dependent receptor-like, beta-barrel/TonB-dependent Receptor Plug Domain